MIAKIKELPKLRLAGILIFFETPISLTVKSFWAVDFRNEVPLW